MAQVPSSPPFTPAEDDSSEIVFAGRDTDTIASLPRQQESDRHLSLSPTARGKRKHGFDESFDSDLQNKCAKPDDDAEADVGRVIGCVTGKPGCKYPFHLGRHVLEDLLTT